MRKSRHSGESRNRTPLGRRLRLAIPAFAGMTALLAGVAFAQAGMPKPETLASRPGATGGEALYVQHCAMCHGANGMGTGLLARRGGQSPLLEQRRLPIRYVVNAARRGIGNMPAITPGEVSEEDLLAIAEYLQAGPSGGGQ